ncbi:MAG TPA: hypothetical protein VF625_11755, partial [Longimicrobium sp.]
MLSTAPVFLTHQSSDSLPSRHIRRCGEYRAIFALLMRTLVRRTAAQPRDGPITTLWIDPELAGAGTPDWR